jgi:hypothetical protein
MPETLIGYARCSTDDQDLTAQRDRLRELGVAENRIYLGHGLTGTDVAAAGGIGPVLAAGLDPAGYPVVPGGVPQAQKRAEVYLGLCERYQELYQA